MSWLIPLTTSVIVFATTLFILGRLFQKEALRRRRVFLSSSSATNTLTVNSFNDTRKEDRRIAGFLHPYCNAGGGGERVLFAAIAYLQVNDPNVLSVVYTGDVDSSGAPISKQEILKRCRERFGITLDESKVEFIHLKWRWLVEDSTWKRFTLIGQGLGAALLGAEAMWRLVPDVFLDTHGLAFSYPVARYLGGAGPDKKAMPIVAYIHYPTISASMLARVSNRETTYANNVDVSSSAWRSTAKLLYYRLFSFIYTTALLVSPPSFLSVNSSWTKAHVDALLKTRRETASLLSVVISVIELGLTLAGWSEPSAAQETRVRRIYPPCDVQSLRDFSLKGRKKVVFSCAQFRPEKDHAKQIQAFALLFKAHPELFVSEENKNGSAAGLKLVLLGSARHKEDLERVEVLKKLAKDLGIESHVEFRLNAPYSELLHWLSVSSIGISTMVEEHFGIGVVEFMGAGLIPVVHASGGPIMDIVVPVDGHPTAGYLASSAEEFAAQLYTALRMDENEALAMRTRARDSSARFSTEAFERGFGALWEDVKKVW
ncbi:glycosyltransferase family 4 protein [Serendipita vermifera MAFF 305830]|uniref:GDP-Man:Man(3)GlcNAc(2)-PP-Dol alpha-1,2-mannosyltransferase n=1 Tax=Serendipita vermifera MAFF 305830 TaxID=933852 RepID=A0A0C3BDD2_SERVB|nr:glycosyltransferase family 4 protein [Serendipita vermifera MAFF 305830]